MYTTAISYVRPLLFIKQRATTRVVVEILFRIRKILGWAY